VAGKIVVPLTLALLLAGLALGPSVGRAQKLEVPHSLVQASSLGSTFTYQGLLTLDGNPTTGPADFLFRLYDAESGGHQIGSAQAVAGVATASGVFTVRLDFGAAAFDGSRRWLEMAVRFPAGAGTYVTLAPRQEINATPYALHALSAGSADTVDGAHAGTGPGQVLKLDGIGQVPLANYSARDDLNSEGLLDGNSPSDLLVRAQGDARYALAWPRVPALPSLNTIDEAGTIGRYTSITVGADGLGLIAYYDVSVGRLKVAHCADVACSSATTSSLDAIANQENQRTSIAIGADGLGLISYYDPANHRLKVAHCLDLACTSASYAVVDGSADVGQYSSLAIGVDGLGLIAYYDSTNQDLKAAHCQTPSCNSASLATLDSSGDVGWDASLVIGSDGLGLVSYYDATGLRLKAAHCADIACSSASLSVLDAAGNTGRYTSATVGADGLPIISYFDLGTHHLRTAHCTSPLCSSATSSTLDWAADLGPSSYTAVSVGADGLPLIAYYDSTNQHLKVAHCLDNVCAKTNITTIDGSFAVGQYVSLTMAADGFGLLSYYDAANGNLKTAHCPNVFCLPYFRRR